MCLHALSTAIRTDTGLSDLSKDVPEALYTLPDGFRVADEPIDCFRCLFRIHVECWVVHVRKERWTLGWEREIVRDLLLPFLRPRLSGLLG